MKNIASAILAAFLTFTTIATPAHCITHRRISIDVRDADIVDIIRLLATESNSSILTDNSVKREKSNAASPQRNVRSETLDILSRAYGLEVRHENGIMIIREQVAAASIHLRYAKASDVVKAS